MKRKVKPNKKKQAKRIGKPNIIILEPTQDDFVVIED